MKFNPLMIEMLSYHCDVNIQMNGVQCKTNSTLTVGCAEEGPKAAHKAAGRYGRTTRDSAVTRRKRAYQPIRTEVIKGGLSQSRDTRSLGQSCRDCR